MSTDDQNLQGLNVLVTRPEARARQLCEMIERAGGRPLHFAAIEIGAPASTASRDAAIEGIDRYDLAIFISPTAVEQTLARIPSMPGSMLLGCIGSQTARALRDHGLEPDIIPEGHDSDALLAHPALQAKRMSGREIIIFRGEGGRDQLADTLRSRGAQVFQADMYRRMRPAASGSLAAMLRAADIVCVSSNAGLDNLHHLAETSELVCKPLVVPGQRAAERAAEIGFTQIVRAASATDKDCLDALKYFVQMQNNGPSE